MRNSVKLKFMTIMMSAVVFNGCAAAKKDYTDSFFGFDTYVSITAEDLKSDEQESLKQLLTELDKSFSSAYGVNANTLDDENLRECAAEAAEFSKVYGDTVNLTIGAVTELWGISSDSPCVPDNSLLEAAMLTIDDTDYRNGDFKAYPDGVKLDFGAAAKGYACDKVYEMLEQAQTEHLVLSMGSSTLLYGKKSDGSKFKAAVKDPFEPSRYLGIVETDSAFVSTSGGYERFFEYEGVKYEHILSPETGYPVETDLVSVTVIVPVHTENGGLLSDMLSTAIYAEGTAGLGKYLDSSDFFVIAADKNNNVYTTSGVDFTIYEESGFVPKV